MKFIQLKDKLGFEYKDEQELKKKLSETYAFQGYKPQVKVDGNIISIEMDDHLLDSTQGDFDRACQLCDAQKYGQAIPLLKEIVKACPLHTDAYRTIAQCYMMTGDLEKAADYNIEALRIDAGNLWALVLMGNIMSRKNDIDTAMSYYDKVLSYHPENAIALNNIGAALLEKGKFDEAINIFTKSLEADNSYMNAYYGLALAYNNKGDAPKALDTAMQGILQAADRKENPQVREELLKLMLTAAMNIVDRSNYMHLVSRVKEELRAEFGADIRIENDPDLKLSALLQYGKAHHRKYHLVKYNATRKYTEHLMLHELMHLRMNLKASREGSNKLLGYNEKCRKNFWSRFGKYFNNISVRLGKEKTNKFADSMLKGISLQLMNCPLDLLVEDMIYNDYSEARPLQLLSLFEQEQENISSISQGLKNPGMFPNHILRASKIMNMVTSLHLKELFGLNFLHYYKPTAQEMKEAEDLYEEYKAYRADYKPGEEYDMVMYFIEQLDCEDFIEMFNEDKLPSPESGAAGGPGLTEQEKQEVTQDFNDTHKDGADPAETFMMSMYMMGAMEYFEQKPLEEVRRIAMEIAMLGCGGISPAQKSGYRVASIPDKDFGGYQLLAYYYVSWAIAIPDKLDALNLPFKTAYETARQMYNAKKKP